MTAKKKRLRFVFVTDDIWNKIVRYSEENKTSKSDALSFLLNKPEPEPEKLPADYNTMLAGLRMVMELVESVKPPETLDIPSNFRYK